MKKILILSIFLFVLLLGSVNASLEDGLISWWKLDSTVNDSSPNGNDAVNYGGVFINSGIINEAINFSSTFMNSSSVQIALEGTDELSLSLWVNMTNLASAEGAIVHSEGSSERQLYLVFVTTDLMFKAADGICETGIDTVNGSMIVNNWHHVVITQNITGNHVWIDGVHNFGETCAVNGTFEKPNDLGVALGNAQYGFFNYNLSGAVDEVGFWNKTLSDSEISDLYNSGVGITYGDWGNIDVALNSPSNAAQTSSDPMIFNATITPSVYNLTNTTIYIWHDNGTLFNTSINTLSGDTPSNTSWNIYNFIIDNYIWNVLGVQGDGVGANSSFAGSNFTLGWIPFEVDNEIFNTETFETKNETIYINVTTDEGVTNLGAFLIYNGTYYAAYHSCSAGLCQIERELDIPLLVNQANDYENKSFHWQITLFGDFGTFTSNTTANEQNVSNIDFSTTASYNAVRYEIYNESSLNLMFAEFDATFTYYLGTGSVSEDKNYSLSGGHTYNLSINHNETFRVNATIKLTNSSNTREYFFLKEVYTNITTIQELFIPHADISNIIIEVKDQGLIPLEGYLVKIFRFYPDLNDYKLVESQLTDELGQFVGKLVQNNEKYKFEFYDQEKVLQKTSEKITVACRSAFCILPFVIETADEDFERFENLTLFSYDFEFNNVTNTFTLLWDDQRQETSTIRLEVTRFQFNQSSVVCDTSSTTKVSSMSCAVGSQKASYKGQVFRSVNGGEERRIAIITISVGNPYSTFGVEGLLWVFILLFTSVGVGAFNPVAGASIYGAGFLIFGVIGLISMPIPVFFANTLLVVLFIWAVRT